MKFIFYRFVLVLAVISASTVRAQMPGMDSPVMDTAMLKLFGSHSNFTATADLRALNSEQKELMGLSFSLAMLDGKMRAEMDMAKLKSAMITPQMLAQMKQAGADQSVQIVRPDLKKIYSVYPSLKAYLETPLKGNTNAAKAVPLQKTALGKETIDGHPCVKNKVVVTDDQGERREATVWNATDLKDFPVQMRIEEKEAIAIIRFQNVQFAKPDAKQFQPPAGFAKYASQQQLQQVMMQKMMGQMQKPPAAK